VSAHTTVTRLMTCNTSHARSYCYI